MQDILVLGAGKIGVLISGLLAESGDYRVQLGDSKPGVAAEVAEAHNSDNVTAYELDAKDQDKLVAHVREHKPVAVISSLPYFCNVAVAEVARAEGLHYFDLTEDVEVTKAVRKLGEVGNRLPGTEGGAGVLTFAGRLAVEIDLSWEVKTIEQFGDAVDLCF